MGTHIDMNLSYHPRIIKRKDLTEILEEALVSLGGEGRIVEICEYIWNNYNNDLLSSGDIFYTWQYDLRMSPRFQERCHPFDPSIRGLEDMTNASLQRGC